jgi:hypothetical protein
MIFCKIYNIMSILYNIIKKNNECIYTQYEHISKNYLK